MQDAINDDDEEDGEKKEQIPASCGDMYERKKAERYELVVCG